MASEPQARLACRICRRPVSGPHDGVAFGIANRPLFVTCHAHAPVVRVGADVLSRAALTGLRTLLERRAPTVLEALDLFRRARQQQMKELEK